MMIEVLKCGLKTESINQTRSIFFYFSDMKIKTFSRFFHIMKGQSERNILYFIGCLVLVIVIVLLVFHSSSVKKSLFSSSEHYDSTRMTQYEYDQCQALRATSYDPLSEKIIRRSDLYDLQQNQCSGLKEITDGNCRTQYPALYTPCPTTRAPLPSPTQYELKARYQGYSLTKMIPYVTGSEWIFFKDQDPTNGLVRYGGNNNDLVELVESQVNSSVVYQLKLGVSRDVQEFEITKADNSKEKRKGRRSVRLESQQGYDNGLFIIDVARMPAAPSCWPAFWLLGKETLPDRWPCYGEIDVIEGVINTKSETVDKGNKNTLHTSKIKGSTGDYTDDCFQCSSSGSDASRNDKTWGCGGSQSKPDLGCSLTSINPKSFGKAFNDNGGGIFACEVTDNGKVTIWFWQRGDAQIPKDLYTTHPDPSTWESSYIHEFNPCPGYFKNLHLILNTTLCGDWAGSFFDLSLSDPKTENSRNACTNYVIDETKSDEFVNNGYWLINGLVIYQKIPPAPVTPSTA